MRRSGGGARGRALFEAYVFMKLTIRMVARAAHAAYLCTMQTLTRFHTHTLLSHPHHLLSSSHHARLHPLPHDDPRARRPRRHRRVRRVRVPDDFTRRTYQSRVGVYRRRRRPVRRHVLQRYRVRRPRQARAAPSSPFTHLLPPTRVILAPFPPQLDPSRCASIASKIPRRRTR